MDNELELNLDEIESNSEQKLQVKNRFQQLSDKVKLEAQEKDKALAEAKANAEKAEQAQKETEFYKSFSQLSSKHPEAINYQAQILDRVNRGYDAEEATLAVLAKEGKLTQAPQQVRTPSAEGGSAMTNISEGDKPLNDLTRDEKLSALQELEKSGELQQALRAGINRS